MAIEVHGSVRGHRGEQDSHGTGHGEDTEADIELGTGLDILAFRSKEKHTPCL